METIYLGFKAISLEKFLVVLFARFGTIYTVQKM